ncbi:hybrid signal transduction histidine kinase L [Drosophila willistoni]|uniref:hybrid signal transduction histidine kinase L n=1 Tax=Drosophila willistoni TaxID=7260 RepID=UPI00017D95E0|nr:hybrid signal transduction histidine kinase L [Drosophila willistoni]
MFWTAVASSTLASTSAAGSEHAAAMASASPNYQQQHIKPFPRSSTLAKTNSWQISHAAFKTRQQKQQFQLQMQMELEQVDEEHHHLHHHIHHQNQHQHQHQHQVDNIGVDDKKKEQKQKPLNNNKKKISPKSESKILKAFTSCKCTQREQKELN